MLGVCECGFECCKATGADYTGLIISNSDMPWCNHCETRYRSRCHENAHHTCGGCGRDIPQEEWHYCRICQLTHVKQGGDTACRNCHTKFQ